MARFNCCLTFEAEAKDHETMMTGMRLLKEEIAKRGGENVYGWGQPQAGPPAEPPEQTLDEVEALF